MCTVVMFRAIYTMHKFCKDMDPAAALAKTIAQLVHDAKTAFCKVCLEGFMYMIGDFFDENLIQPCVSLVKPIEDAIPEAFKVYYIPFFFCFLCLFLFL